MQTPLDVADVDADALAAQVDAVLNDDLYWFPVRHHSAAVARHLETVIAQRRPKVVFIEGPSEAQELIPFVIDSETRPPIAIYSSYRDDDNVLGLAGSASPAEDIPPRFACWYPLLAYSPEFVAMQAAARVDADVVFIDLPHFALLERRMGTPARPPDDRGPDIKAEDRTAETPHQTEFEDRARIGRRSAKGREIGDQRLAITEMRLVLRVDPPRTLGVTRHARMRIGRKHAGQAMPGAHGLLRRSDRGCV